MPRATAVWLIENTNLTFEQIADFCGLHQLEIKSMADGEADSYTVGMNPIDNNQLTWEEIKRCEDDKTRRLNLCYNIATEISAKKGKSKYTPIAKRQDKPNAISWIIRNHPEISDKDIGKLIGTTKTTIESIRTRTHWNIKEINPIDPVMLGVCSQRELNAMIDKYSEKKGGADGSSDSSNEKK